MSKHSSSKKKSHECQRRSHRLQSKSPPPKTHVDVKQLPTRQTRSLKKSSSKYVSAEPPPVFSRPVGDHDHEGHFGGTNLPTTSVRWRKQDKELFISHAYVVQTARESAYKMISPASLTTPNFIETDVLKSKTRDGMVIRWTGLYADPYISELNVMPTRRFFDFIEYKAKSIYTASEKKKRTRMRGKPAR